jgi:RNA polymerase sigma factor (sigma-70 family)
VSSDSRKALVTGLLAAQGPRLRRFLAPRVRNLADIPDIVQEVFLRMLRVPDQEAIRSPEAYLFVVAQHVAQQHALHESRTPPSIEITQMLSELTAAADADPALQASSQQSLEALDRALQRFSPKVRATFILNRHYGLTLEQISARLGISLAMAKKYLTKALLQIRAHMEERE